MKKLIILLLIFLFIGCEQECVQRVIPEKNQEKANKFVIEQMEAIKLTSRYENEDYDDFLAQAKRNALEIYGIDTLGIWFHETGSTPFDKCTPEQKESLKKRMKK